MNLKKILALVLVLAMLVSMVPTYAFAEDVELWDEEEVAVQDDAALEDVYLDEEPEEVIVEDEPKATEPEAVEVEEPAAEEPAAVEEPVAAAEAAPVAETVLSTEETNDFEAGEVALVASTGTMYTTLAAAIDAAAEGDTITMLATASDVTVYIQKSLTIRSGDVRKIATNVNLMSGTLTLQNVKTSTISVTGGTLSIAANDNGDYGTVTAAPAVTGAVKGGTFAEIPTALLEEGYIGEDSIVGDTVTIGEKTSGKIQPIGTDFVAVRTTENAKIYYKTLKAAFAYAQNDETVKLLKTVTISKAEDTAVVDGNKSITLDLNGQNIEATYGAVIKVDQAKLTITGTGTIDSSNAPGYSQSGQYYTIQVLGAANNTTTTAYPYGLSVGENVTIKSNGYAVQVQQNSGAAYGVQVDLKGVIDALYGVTVNGSITATTGNIPVINVGGTIGKMLYAAGYAKYNVNAVINNDSDDDTAIEIRAGEMNITGGTYTSTSNPVAVNPNGSGTTSTGSAIAVAQHDTKLPIKLKISGGQFTGYSAFYESNPQKNSATDLKKIVIEITNGTFNTNNGGTAVVYSQDVATIGGFIKGGTFSNAIPENCCYTGYIPVKNDDGTYGVEIGTYVARVADYAGNKDYTKLGQGYTTVDEAITEALKPVESGKPVRVLVILNDIAATDKISLKDGDVINIWYKAGVTKRYAEANFTVGENVKVVKLDDLTGYVHPWGAVGYIAQVSTKGSTATPVKFLTLDGDNGAFNAAKNQKSKVLKLLKATDTDITLANEDDFINIDESELKITVNAAAGLVAVPSGEGTVTYVAKKAVASYKNAAGEDVYTMSFAKAAIEGAKNADFEGKFEVTLYQTPAFDDTTKDVYALGANSKLIVKTDETAVWNALKKQNEHYKAELYKLIVTNDGEVAVKTTLDEDNKTITYEAATPVAKVKLNTEEPTFEYFTTAEDAVKFVVEEHYNEHLVLIPMANKTFTATSNQIAGIDTADEKPYLGKAIRIDNSGDFILKLADVEVPQTGGAPKYYTYTATPGDGYTNYILNSATVKIPAKPEMNIYYDTVPGSDTKFFASFAEAVAADSTAVVELIATPTDAQDQFTTETYKLGIPDGPITVKAKLGNFDWLIVKAYDETLAVKAEEDPDDEDVTVYSLDSAVASITFGTGTAAETVLYSSFAEAAAAQLASSQSPKPVIELINSDLTEYALADDATLTVEKNGKEIKVVAAIASGETAPTKAILETLGEDGITTTYASVAPVAEINFGTQAKHDVKLYGSFADAVKAAYTPAGTEATLVIKLRQNPLATDIYEVAAAGSFLVDNDGQYTASIERVNLKAAENAAVVLPATAENVSGNIWRVTVAKAAASAAFPAGTRYYSTFDAAAGEASNTSLAGAVTITLLDDVNDVYKLNPSHFMKVAKGTYKLNVEADNPTSGTTAFYIDEVKDASTGVTSYSPAKAAASVGTGTDIKYYATFDEAATASAGTKTITLYNNNSNVQTKATYSYVLGAEGKVSELHVEKNGQNLTVTSGVTGREVKYTTGSPVVYTLISPVAHTEVNGVADKYFGMIDEAVEAASSTTTPTKTLVLDAAVTADIKLADGKQIDLKAGSYLGTHTVVATTASTYFVVPTPNGDVTNYKSVEIVAKIGDTPYATFEAAAAEAYVTGDATPVKTVKLIKKPTAPSTDTTVVADIFNVTAAGSISIDQSNNAETQSTALKPNFKLAEGLVYTYERVGEHKYIVKIVAAEAYTIRNNGVDKDYYETVAEACAVSARYPVNPPVVYLMKSELSYALAQRSTIRVNKMGYDDFAVTKATPTELEPKYAIVETVNGDVSTYTTSTDEDVLVAVVNFATDKPDGDYGMETVNNYVYYTKFADAAKAANGEKAITLLADLDKEYTLGMDETVIIATNTDVTGIKAPEGYALNSDNESVSGQITYTVVSCVASVNYTWETDKAPYDKPYGDLADALKDAIALYDGNSTQNIKGAYLTLWAPVAEDFTYTLGEKDWIRVKNVEDYEFNVSNFVAPNGYYASFDTNVDGENGYTIIKPARALASIGEGADIQYFNSFADAVDAAVEVETNSGHYGDKQNPQSVITLYADNKDGYTFSAPTDTTNVRSLLIKAGEHKTNLTAPDGYFVEVTPANQEGVSKYEVKQIIASVESGPTTERVTTNFSSFAAAAQAALNSVEAVEMQVYAGALDPEDIFEMPVGTLTVKFINGQSDPAKAAFAGNHITVKAEKARLVSEKLEDRSYFYTVTGAVASITNLQGTSYYYDMGQAINWALDKANIVIVPLTDIDYYYVPDSSHTITAGTTFFNVADSEYDVQIRAKDYELAHEGTKYTFKDAVAYVTTDDVLSVDPETNEPTYIDQYFSKFEDAVDFADNTKTIVLLENVTYEFKDVDTVINLLNKYGKALNRSCYIPGYEMVREEVENSDPQIVKFYVAGYETITLDAGDGAWTKGTESRSILTGKAVTGVDIQNLKTDDKASADQWQIFGNGSVGLPELTGYKPAYWVDDEGNKYLYKFTLTDAEKTEGYNPLPDKMPKGGITLTAVWVPNEYWVDYRTNIDNSVKTVKFTYGELLEVPEGVNVRENYEFAGWFTSADCKPTQAFDIANTKITNELGLISDVNSPATGKTWVSGEGYITLYAKFVPKQFTVTFDTLCDTVIPNQRVDFNSQIVKPTTALTKEGYTFSDSWHYINADGETHTWNFSDPVTGDITLIADWDAKQLRLIWADGSYVIQRDAAKDVGTPTDAPDYSSRTNPGYRIDPAKAWIDDDGDLFTGKVPVKDATQWIYRLNWIEQINVIFVDGGKKLGQVTVDKGTTLADAKDVPAPTKEGYTLVWQLEGEDYDVKAPIQEELLLTASWVEGQDVSDYATVVSSLSLDNNINLNAYVTIKENTLPGDYEVKVEFNGKTMMEGTLDTVGTYIESSGEYKLSDIAVIAAPQMNDAATVTITYQGKEVLSKDLTVRAYAEEWIEKSTKPKLVELLKALLDFGAYSQIQFNYQTNNLANSKYSTGKVPTTVVPVYSVKVDGSATGITGASTSLTLVSNTALNVYFAVQKTGSYKFAVDGTPVKATYSNKEYKVVLENILVADLDTEHVFTATLNGETYTMTCAPLAYAYQHQNDGNALGDVCKAVYVYFDAADAYFG